MGCSQEGWVEGVGGEELGWFDGDEGTWDQAVDKLVELLLVQPGTTVDGDEVRMKASQWVVVAQK